MREIINNFFQEVSATPPQAWVLLIIVGAVVAMLIRVQFENDKYGK